MTPWPQTKPQGTGMFSAVAVDPASDRVWVAQRNASYKNPILVYNTAGALLGSWGKGDIAELNVRLPVVVCEMTAVTGLLWSSWLQYWCVRP